MICKLTIENFQSHSHTELNLSPGVNVILGETDSGKSAVVRALRWLWFNEPRGDGFVRRGARKCRVRAEFGDGSAVERARENGRNLYRVAAPGVGEEEVYEGFGSAVPEEAARAAGAVRIEANGVTLTPSLANQMDPPFVIGESPATAAAVVGLISRAEAFDAALKDANADAARLKREARSLEEEIAAFDRQLEEFADLPAWEEAIAAASAALDAARRAEARKERLAELAAAWVGASTEALLTEAVLNATAGLDEAAAEIARAADGLERLQTLERLREARRENWAVIANTAVVLKRTSGIGTATGLTGEAAEIATRAERLKEVRRRLLQTAAELDLAEKNLAATAGVEAADQVLAASDASFCRLKALRSLSTSLAAAERDFLSAAHLAETAGKAAEAGERLAEAEKASGRLKALAAMATALAAARQETETASAAVTEAAEQIKRTTGELTAALASMGRCPVCFRKLEGGEIDDVVKNLVGA